MYDIYEPAEDSFLLQKYVHHYANGRVLDMGTGSGIQAITAIQNPSVTSILAIDINPSAVNALKNHIKTNHLKNIKVKQSDLFQGIPKTKFDTIIFNPPYLPQDPGIVDPALYGGKKGYELSERFFQEVSDYLETDGQILFLFSTLTNKVKIEQILAHNLLSWEELGTEKVSFETLYVYRITKNPLRIMIESHHIRSILYYNKGKRGLVYKGILLKNRSQKHVAIKINQPASPSCRLDLECRVLRDVNRVGIGPEFYAGNKDYLIMEFIDGTTFPSWLPSATPLQVRRVLGKLLAQCFALDQEHYTKEEMHHPFKHIIITAQNHPVLIDFERCTKTDSPKNITQFVEYLCRIQNQLSQKDISFNILHIRAHAKAYKHSPTRSNYTTIRTLLLS